MLFVDGVSKSLAQGLFTSRYFKASNPKTNKSTVMLLVRIRV